MPSKDIDSLVLPKIGKGRSSKKGGPSADDMIWIKELIKVYKSGKIEVTALRGISTTIKKGEIVAIVGPSGCGKTTLLNIVGGLDEATAGKVYVDGKNIRDLKEDHLVEFRRGTVGFIFQNFNLTPSLTAEENIELPMRLSKVPKDLREKRLTNLFRSIGLEDRRGHRPEQLSGGEQQRVAFAVALANDPPLILADEPTGELDTKTGQEIMEIFKTLSRQLGKTEVIVTHDPRIAEFADRTLRIVDGKIVKEG